MYTLYIVRCADATFYTGITVHVTRRVREHNTSRLGAKYTRGRRPVKLVYTQKFRNRSSASKAEARIKRFPRAAKLRFVRSKGKVRL